MAVSPGGTHAESATLRTADGLLCRGVPAAFGRNVGRLGRLQVVRAQPDLADVPLQNASEARGALVLVTRGTVPFVEKARRVAAAGAAGVVIVNNVNEPYVAHGHQYPDGRVDNGDGITIPVVCVRLGDGSALSRRAPCRVSLDFGALEPPLSSRSASVTGSELHTPPPLPRRATVAAHEDGPAAAADEDRGAVVNPSPRDDADVSAVETAGTLAADLGGTGAEQANFTPDALHSPAAPLPITQPNNGSAEYGDRRVGNSAPDGHLQNREDADSRRQCASETGSLESMTIDNLDGGGLTIAASTKESTAAVSPVPAQRSPMSPMSPKQLAARAAAMEARVAKQLAQAASESSARSMHMAQQKAHTRQHRNLALPVTHNQFVCGASSATGTPDFASRARTSSEESFLAHERAAAEESDLMIRGEQEQEQEQEQVRQAQQQQQRQEEEEEEDDDVPGADGGDGMNGTDDIDNAEEALPSASTFRKQIVVAHRVDAAANGTLETPSDEGSLTHVADSTAVMGGRSDNMAMLRGSLRSRTRRPLPARIATSMPADEQTLSNSTPGFHSAAPLSGNPSVLRSVAGSLNRTRKGISFSARDQVAKFSQYDSPTTIYMAGEEPLEMQSPVNLVASASSPARTAFSLDQLEAEYGVNANDHHNTEDSDDEDEDASGKEQWRVNGEECKGDAIEQKHGDRASAHTEPQLQGHSKRADDQQERMRQRTKQQELLRQLQDEDSRVIPVRRASHSIAAEIAIGSLRIDAAVAEFGLSRGELPLSLEGVPVVSTDPIYAETSVTNNPSIYRGAVAVVRRGGGVSFAKKAKRVQDAGAVGCIIVNEEDRVMERVAAKAGDLDAREVDIPVLCVALHAGEALLAMLPAALSIQVWMASMNRERRKTQRTLAGGGIKSGARAVENKWINSGSERTVRKQLIVSLQRQLQDMETAKKAAEASVARLEERLAVAARTASRERDKQSTMLAALQNAQQAQAVAEEARAEAQEKTQQLEKENEGLMERLAVYTREESEALTLHLSHSRRGKQDSSADGEQAASRSRRNQSKDNGKRRRAARLRKEAAADSTPESSPDHANNSRDSPPPTASVAVHQGPVSIKTGPLVSDALQQLQHAMEAQVLNNDCKAPVVEQRQQHRRRTMTSPGARTGAAALTPERQRQLCGDGDRLVVRHVASVLGTATESREGQDLELSHPSTVEPHSQEINGPRGNLCLLQSTTNRHNAAGWIRQPRGKLIVEPHSPLKCPSPAMDRDSCEPDQQENEGQHLVHPSLHYNREGVASVGEFGEFSGPAQDEDWADHARRVASVLRRGHSASTLASSAPAGTKRKKRQALAPRGGSGWNSSVSVGAF